jgi:hypothetical protein
MPVIPSSRALHVAVLLVLLCRTSSIAGVVSTIDFETLPGGSVIVDSTPITTQFSGLTFANTTAITAGITLNEFEFPPQSGTTAVFDDGGPLSITFDTPVLNLSGYFTYSALLTLEAFNTTGILVGTATSLFSNNELSSGNSGSSPNELLQVAFAGGISVVRITADPGGTSFVLDSLSFESSVPEPNSIILLLTGMAAIITRTLRQQ